MGRPAHAAHAEHDSGSWLPRAPLCSMRAAQDMPSSERSTDQRSCTEPLVQADEVVVSLTERWQRATGAAVGAAVGLLESCVPGSGARAMVFTGGPCTRGPGLVVGPNKADPIRTHKVGRLIPVVNAGT